MLLIFLDNEHLNCYTENVIWSHFSPDIKKQQKENVLEKNMQRNHNKE